jgi:hypothetical protein
MNSYNQLMELMQAAYTLAEDDVEEGHTQADNNLIEVALHCDLTREQREMLVQIYISVPKHYA